MKLCRFELRREPGNVKSGIVHNGRIYETDGANPIAVHEAEDVRPLAPVGHIPSVRWFPVQANATDDPDALPFAYLNPTVLSPSNTAIPIPDVVGTVSVLPCLVAVVGGQGRGVPLELADEAILGLSLAMFLTSPGAERTEKTLGIGPGRSLDLGGVLGPVVVTPEELEDHVVGEEVTRRYRLEAVLRVNGVERGRTALEDLNPTPGRAAAFASETAPLHPGDLLVLGPIAAPEEPLFLEPGDEVKLAVEVLGTLALKVQENL